MNTDEFRRAIFHIDESKKDQIFPQEWRDVPYRAIFIAAKKLLQNNINVVIDAALYNQKIVDEARSLSQESKLIKLICPEALTKQRLEDRVAKSGAVYSAGPKVYDYVKSFTEDIPGVDLVVDTSKELGSQLERI